MKLNKNYKGKKKKALQFKNTFNKITKQEKIRSVEQIKNIILGIQIRDLLNLGILFFTTAFGYSNSDRPTIYALYANQNFLALNKHDEYQKIIDSFHSIKKIYNVEAHTIENKDLYSSLKIIDSTYIIEELQLIKKICTCQLFGNFLKIDPKESPTSKNSFAQFNSHYENL